jgi:hypothetical protein
MVSRSKVYRKSYLSGIINSETVSEIRVVSLYPSNLFITGPSGKEYHFPVAGSEVNVLKEDIEYLLSKRFGKPCCGGAGNGPIFELVI